LLPVVTHLFTGFIGLFGQPVFMTRHSWHRNHFQAECVCEHGGVDHQAEAGWAIAARTPVRLSDFLGQAARHISHQGHFAQVADSAGRFQA